eukprot:21538-Heterococcus_DN1.PRE.2
MLSLLPQLVHTDCTSSCDRTMTPGHCSVLLQRKPLSRKSVSTLSATAAAPVVAADDVLAVVAVCAAVSLLVEPCSASITH